MNYRIAKTMLVLCVIYLVGFYVLKFAFPELLLQTITSPTMLRLGEFVKKWVGFEYIIRIICNFITFYLFACASCGRFKFAWKKIVLIFSLVIVNNLICDYLPELYTHTAISCMFTIAYACNGKLKYTVISFVLHGYLSCFLTSIRGFATIIIKIAEIGILSSLLLGLEVYVWLALLAIIFYFKEEKYERNCTPVYQQTCGTKES